MLGELFVLLSPGATGGGAMRDRERDARMPGVPKSLRALAVWDHLVALMIRRGYPLIKAEYVHLRRLVRRRVREAAVSRASRFRKGQR